ncbi:MAG TPA: DUF92 domain-containing protein [Candidatus Bilamarchaeaceae archaeon]|nr:DUF92 domain-containing protein [Candidatus Bilamarchaeaceae archaeon]
MVFFLDKEGIVLALSMSFVITYFGGFEALFLMLTFLFLSVLATKYEYQRKKEMGIYEHERSWENVLANGIFPTILAVLTNTFGIIPYICSVAAITADKFGSELGVLGGRPFSLLSFKNATPGESGAISLLGTAMSLVGGLLIGVTSIVIFNLTPSIALLVGFAGFLASIVDTLFGVLEEKGIGTKGTTNFICSVAGGILGYLLIPVIS